MAKKKLTPKQVKALVAKEEKKFKPLKKFKGEFVALGRDKEHATEAAVKANNTARIFLTAPKLTTERTATRIVRMPGPRITPKTPRLRK